MGTFLVVIVWRLWIEMRRCVDIEIRVCLRLLFNNCYVLKLNLCIYMYMLVGVAFACAFLCNSMNVWFLQTKSHHSSLRIPRVLVLA